MPLSTDYDALIMFIRNAGPEFIADQGTAVDMALAGLLAGAARASSASLLGAAGVLLGGPGMGLHFVDGRARAPGIGTVRPKSVEAPGDATRNTTEAPCTATAARGSCHATLTRQGLARPEF